MKILLAGAVAALSIGASVAPASAQYISVGPRADRGDCRTVETRKYRNGRTVITRERQCRGGRYSERSRYRERDDDRYERRVYRDRYDDRRGDRPGIYIGR